ncbi:MAG: co-chaperone GroES [Planctomycetota bacterium]|jgi:chaperonin GroES
MAKKATTATKSNTKVVPLGDRVLLRRETAESTTAGGIVLPDSAKDKPQRGEIIAVGEGITTRDGKKHPLTVKAGDKVIFSSYAGDEFKLDDEELVLMREADILAIYA